MSDFMMFVRNYNNAPIGTIAVEHVEKNMYRVATNLCHPKDVGQFNKKTAWDKIMGKFSQHPSSKTHIVMTESELLNNDLENIFKRFDYEHLYGIPYNYDTLPKVLEGDITKSYLREVMEEVFESKLAEKQLNTIRDNNEKFKRTVRMLTEKVAKINRETQIG